MSDTLSIRCPDCGARLEVDRETGMVLSHQRQPGRSVDLERSQDLLRQQDQERERRFQQSVAAEKKRDELLAKKFDQSLRRVRDNPDEPRPLRDVDLD